MEWQRTFAEAVDETKEEHLQWIYSCAEKRAHLFGIEGVTYETTKVEQSALCKNSLYCKTQ